MNNIQELRELIFNKLDSALITSQSNRYYFTGIKSSEGALVVTTDKAILLIDFRYYEIAKKAISKNGYDIEVVLLTDLKKQLKNIVLENKLKTMGFEAESITVTQCDHLKGAIFGTKVDTSGHLDSAIKNLRSIKSTQEIDKIKTAQMITDAGFNYILNFIKAGISEKAIATELEFYLRKNGADEVAFNSIVVSGKNSSLPHGEPSEKVLKLGDMVTMDFGARLDGYNSDMTRTVCIGKASEEQKKVYDTVIKAQNAAFESIAPGEACDFIDKRSRDIINLAGYEGCFGHGLGHGVGIDIHEEPRFSPSCKTLLKKGMVITVEPGIYLEDKFGVRIEDMVIITESGFENITKSTKKLIEI
jgi:Xaa-Pro aminopeptidase